MKAKHMARKKKMMLLASVASMIDQFNLPNIRLLLDMGYEVHVACNFKEGNTCDASHVKLLQKKLHELGVETHHWDCPRNLHSLSGCLRAYRQANRLMQRYAVDWLHCQSPIGGALARIAARKAGIPVLYTAHGFHFYKGAPWYYWLLYYPVEKLLARWTDVLVTVNKEDYWFARRHLRAGKVFHIPGVGIDTGYFGTIQENPCTDAQQDKEACGANGHCRKEKALFCETYQIPPDACVLLSVGELNEGKNHRMVIDALGKMQRKDLYYLVCGQGRLRERLRRQARRLGVESRLRLPGYQEHMAWIYQNADIFVFPSKREGMPAALMEAMAAGLPCVASDIRGNRELISHEFSFSFKQPDKLAETLRLLADHAQLRQKCGRHNQQTIKSYDQARVDGRMRKIYAQFDKGRPIRENSRRKAACFRDNARVQHGRRPGTSHGCPVSNAPDL